MRRILPWSIIQMLLQFGASDFKMTIARGIIKQQLSKLSEWFRGQRTAIVSTEAISRYNQTGSRYLLTKGGRRLEIDEVFVTEKSL